jgi:hypothetical protein
MAHLSRDEAAAKMGHPDCCGAFHGALLRMAPVFDTKASSMSGQNGISGLRKDI